MASANGAHMYTGVWINWSHGALLGSTLTLSSRDGGLLTAFLAIFISAAGAALWRILSYILHQTRASREHQDGLHHQQQNILRNTSSAGGASVQLTQLIWYWWKFAKRPLCRSLPLALFALLNLVLFAIAGIFSSQVTKAAGDETLVVSPNCGYWATDKEMSLQSLFAQSSKILNDTITAASYARACYGGLQDPLKCNIYTQPQIKWTTNQNASCPFRTGVCYFSDTAAYEMDTGPMDSHDTLGINTPVRDRITYRRVTTCAPIHAKGFATVVNATGEPGTPGRQGDVIEQLWYGPIADTSNYTYLYNDHALLDGNGYSLSTLEALGGYEGNAWLPVPELNRTNADISLFLLAPNSVRYRTPVDDPFFSAHLVNSHVSSNGNNLTWYESDHYVNVLGCADQHQFCNPTNNQCTELTGSTILGKQIHQVGMNAVQQMTYSRLLLNLNFVSTFFSVNGRGSSSLRAQETLYNLDQAPLPNNQWMIEVSSWFAVSMAHLQQSVVEYATGPSYLVIGSYLWQPKDAINVAMCKSQKVRNSFNTISFSLLGVTIILVVGTLLILTNLILDLVVGWIQRRWNIGDYRRLQWVLDDKLQLHRMAYEEAGIGTWSGTTDAVPVTKYGERLGLPPGIDAKHPRLTVRTSGKSEEERLIGPKKGFSVEVTEL